MSTKGITKVVEFQQGDVMLAEGNWDLLYDVSATKHPDFNIGDRVKLPDGREFVYSYSAAACLSGQGCEFTKAGLYGAVASVAGVVGDRQIAVAAGTHDAITKDELRGGYVVIHTAGNTQQFRGIIGNDAAVANAAIKVYLDAPLTAVVAVTILIEVFHNPYAALQTGANVGYAKAGIPAVYVSAASKYFWCQIKGFCFAAPQSGITGKNVGACWRHDGSIDTMDNGIEDSALVSSQYAGHRIAGTADLVGPLFYLNP
jgi:hypothetical protein